MATRGNLFNPKTIQASARKGGNQDFWHRLVPLVYGATFVAICLLGVMMFWPLLQRYYAHEERKREVERQIQFEQVRHVRLQEELYALRDDPLYIERLARDRLHFARQGETIFIFEPYGGDSGGEVRASR